jgi:hypothetical protein
MIREFEELAEETSYFGRVVFDAGWKSGWRG